MDELARLSRRSLLGGAASLGLMLMTDEVGAAAARKPNIVFILADDLGAFDLSCYGRRDYRTPRIDSLAEDGLKFRYGYASSPTCTPTRVGLISGRYPNRLPVGTLEGGGGTTGEMGYAPEWPSLARLLKAAGYRTGLVGKWNLGQLPRFGPNRSGYDEFFGFTGGSHDYWTHDYSGLAPNAPRTPDLYQDERLVQVEGYATDLFADRACDFISRHAARPFLLSLHFNAPHWPWQTRADRGEGRVNDFHFDGGSIAAYAEIMRALDEGVGRVLDTLDRHDLARDTIIVFTSDNGGERFSDLWPLRGAKGELWEGGVRVPLLVRWPGRIARGATSDQVLLSMDWLPTFAALAGAATDPAAPPDGIDLSAQLLGAAPVARTVFWKTPDARSALAFPWKYLEQGGLEYLYNLSEDETENVNFKRRQPDIFARLKAASAAWVAQMLPSGDSMRERLFRNLRALEPPPRP